MAYINDLRRRVVSFVRGGGSKAEAARRYGVHRHTVSGWTDKGDAVCERAKPGPKTSHKLDNEKLKALLKQRPDATLHELGRAHGVHYSTVSYALKRLGYSRKKNVAL